MAAERLTTAGQLYPDAAPRTVANFLEYVKSGHYDGTQFHRVIGGFMVQGAYTIGRAIDDADVAVNVTNYQDAANIQGDRAVAGYDARHKVSLTGLWELPFFRNSSGIARTMLGGWQFAGYAILQSGTPLNVTNGAAFPRGDFNADGNAGDRPNAPAPSATSPPFMKISPLARDQASTLPPRGKQACLERRARHRGKPDPDALGT